MYKLSIITINRNNAEGLRKTIESVVSQTYTDFEYIIIDGASTDESVDVIKEYADKVTFWVSEPDKGIYNAMNKGILKAKGEYLLFLNSGDWLVDEDVVGDFCEADFKEDIISGNLYLWDSKSDKSTLVLAVEENIISYEFFIENILYHQSTFIKLALFETVGLYTEKYKIVSDWEFFIKALVIHNCTYTNFNREIVYFLIGGISSNNEWMNLHLKEREQVFNTFPRIHRMYLEKIEQLRNKQRQVDEYQNFKNGSFRSFIRFALWLKSIKKGLLWK